MGFGTEERERLTRLAEECLWGIMRKVKEVEGISHGRSGGLSWVMTLGEDEGYNSVYRVELPPDRARAGIDRAVERFRSAGLCSLWWLGPTTRPRDLAQRLERRGFRLMESLYGMALDLTRPLDRAVLPEGLELARIEDGERLREVIEIFTPAVGASPLEGRQDLAALKALGLKEGPYRHFAGLLEGAVVSSSSYYGKGEAVNLDFVCSDPDHRGRGFAKAVFLAALEEAVKEGYTRAVLQATEAGRPLYGSLGFEELCAFELWADYPELMD